jgi:hypothetical protein
MRWRSGLAALLILLAGGATAAAGDDGASAAEPLCRLPAGLVRESSGVAASRRHAGVLYTHNDSGDGPLLYAFDRAGERRGVFRVDGAQAVDWEDMAAVRLGGAAGPALLFLGDIGDNRARRERVTVYVVREPAELPRAGQADAAGRRALPLLARIDIAWPEGPTDCEALAVQGGPAPVLYLVAKSLAPRAAVVAVPLTLPALRRLGAEVIEEPPREVEGGGVLPFRHVRMTAAAAGEAAIPAVTAADIAPDGARLVLLTYGNAYEYRRATGETWPRALGRDPREIALPPRPQGEAVAYGPRGKVLYLTSECADTAAVGLARCPVYEVPAPPPSPRR